MVNVQPGSTQCVAEYLTRVEGEAAKVGYAGNGSGGGMAVGCGGWEHAACMQCMHATP